MKKLLSLILAIAMITTFIPAVSANETVDATNNMKIVYNFVGPFAGMTHNNTGSCITQYKNKTDETGSFWKVVNFSKVYSNYRGLDSTITIKEGVADFEINVPVDGTYNAVVNARSNTSGKSNNLNVTIKDSAGNVVNDTVTQKIEYKANAANAVDYNCGTYNLKAGKYTLTLEVPTSNSYWIIIYSFTLSNGENAKVTPFIKEYTAPKSEIAVGEGTTMSVVPSTVLSNCATSAGATTVEYSSDNANIARVDENGNITGAANGTAIVTAKVFAADCPDYYIAKSATVKVGTGESLPQDEITIKYDFAKTPTGNNGVVQYWYTYDKTNGFFAHKSHEENNCNGRALDGTLRIQRGDGTGDYMDFEIEVPKSGDYTVYADWKTHNANVSFDVLVGVDENALTNVANLGATTAAVERTGVVKLNDAKVHLDAGKNLIRLQIPEGFTNTGSSDGWLVIYSFSLVAGSADAIVGGEINLPDKISLGEEENAEAVGYLSSTGAAASFTYASDNTNVVTVDSTTGAIEAVGAGSATITATCADALSGYNTVSKKITVTHEAPTVTLFITASEGDAVTVTVDETAREINKALSENRGANVIVTANDYAGYTFRGWVRGSADRGVWVSSDPEYSFVAMTNTMLTAIYEENVDGKVVEYYNENGEYIATKAVADTAPEVPSLAGYTFNDKWFVSETEALDRESITAALTRAVAKHDAKVNAGTVTVNGNARSEKTFNTPIVLNASKEGFTAWKRDGKVVSYNSGYTYYIWSDTEISESTEAVGEKLPIVVLDADKVDGSWMVEYDSAGFEIAEVGIIFGNSNDMDIDSCMIKANSQRNSDHGQFAATSDYAYARGYLIYNDGGKYKVIYSSAE